MKNRIMIIFLIFNAIYSFGQQSTDLYGDYLGQIPPSDTPVVFARGIISTEFQNHGVPSFSPNGKEVFWQVNRLDNENKWFISIMTMRRIDDRWTSPKISPFTGVPVFSHDGKRIYFGGDKPYYIEVLGDSLSEPKDINLISRFPELKFLYNLSITRNGTLYFLGNAIGLGSRNNYGIYRAELVNGEYTTPELLPPGINASSGVLNWTSFVAPDERYLIFSSNRNDVQRSGGDGCDLYISFRKENGSWTDPVSLGYKINSNQLERFPSLSPDGKYLFFTRWTPDYDEDVFWVSAKIIDQLKKVNKR